MAQLPTTAREHGLVDEDKLLCFESTGPQEDLKIMAKFEANLLYDCALCKARNRIL